MPVLFPRSDASKLRSFSSTPPRLARQGCAGFGRTTGWWFVEIFFFLLLNQAAAVSLLVAVGYGASRASAAACHRPAPLAGLLSALRSCSALFQLLSLRSPPDVSRCTPNAAGLHLQIHRTGKRHLDVRVCSGVCVC